MNVESAVIPKITFYTKPHCPLCDEALTILRNLQNQRRFELSEVNILEDPALYEKYKHDIPVAEWEGQEIFRHAVDAKALRKVLKGANP